MSYLPIGQSLKVFRLSCRHRGCFMVFELPISKIEEAMKKTSACCPLCGKPFNNPEVESGSDVITNLAKAVLAIDKLKDNFLIDFPIPVETQPDQSK